MTNLDLHSLFPTQVDPEELVGQRRRRLVQEMQAAGVDVFVLADPVNVEYATGLARPKNTGHVGLVSATGVAFWSPLGSVTPEGWAERIGALVGELGLPMTGRLAVDDVTDEYVAALAQKLPRWGVESGDQATTVLLSSQLTKTPLELECLRRSQRVVGLAMDAARQALAPGVTPEGLDRVVDDTLRQVDASGEVVTVAEEPDPTARTTWHVIDRGSDGNGPTFPIPFRLPRPFSSPDVIWVDGSVRYHGYCSDYGRTWLVGQHDGPDARQTDAYKRWTEVTRRIAESLRAGQTLSDVDRAARASADRQPWLKHLFYGHGLGLAVPELPLLGTDPEYRSAWLTQQGIQGGPLRAMAALKALGGTDRFVLKRGMVIVLEPVVWDVFSGYRAEDTFIVTDGEPERISDWSHAPFE
jgi:Xaa-Pro dipeptidase